jgi:hypothetical protein
MHSQSVEDIPEEIEEEFWKQVVEYEEGGQTTHAAALKERGIEMTGPEELSDPEVTKKLWELIERLHHMGTYLYHTNHLSDRGLYTRLTKDLLHQHVPAVFTKARTPPKDAAHCYDLVGSGSDEDIEIGLRYYDDEEQRQRWKKDFPDMVIPPREDPPYDRDRLLPKSPFDRPLEPPEPEVAGRVGRSTTSSKSRRRRTR